MIEPRAFHDGVEALSARLTERLGARGRTPRKRLVRARRLLPRALRRDLDEIARAGEVIDHPRLARLTDRTRLEAAFAALDAHLGRVDPIERRRRAVLGVLAVMVFNLTVLGAAIVALLKWRGLL